MADQWMMTMRHFKTSTSGEFVGVAILDFKIERRLMLTLNELDGLEKALLVMEMADVVDALKFASTTKSEQWKFINIPWRSISTVQFDTDSIVKLFERSSRRYWWRLEGNAEQGLKGIITCGGAEVVYDLSRENIVPLVAKVEADIKRCDELEKEAKDEAVRDAIKTFKDIMECIFLAGGSVKLPGGRYVKGGALVLAAANCYLAIDAAKQEADEAKKRAAELAVDDTINRCGQVETGGAGGSPAIGHARGGPDRLTGG